MVCLKLLKALEIVRWVEGKVTERHVFTSLLGGFEVPKRSGCECRKAKVVNTSCPPMCCWVLRLLLTESSFSWKPAGLATREVAPHPSSLLVRQDWAVETQQSKERSLCLEAALGLNICLPLAGWHLWDVGRVTQPLWAWVSSSMRWRNP